MPEDEVVEGNAAPEETSEGTTETSASATEDSNEQTTEEKPKVTGGFQKRIDKLTREKEHWKEQALQALTPKAVASSAQIEAPTTLVKPKADDFATHAEFVEALTDYKVDVKFKTDEAKRNEAAAKTHQTTVQSTFKAKQDEFRATTPDFDEVLEEATEPVSRALIDEVVSHEHGAALQYFLAKNPAETKRLSALSPLALAREIGRMESKFVTAPTKASATLTKAPPPPNPVGRATTTSVKDPLKDDLSPAEYAAWRKKTYPNL